MEDFLLQSALEKYGYVGVTFLFFIYVGIQTLPIFKEWLRSQRRLSNPYFDSRLDVLVQEVIPNKRDPFQIAVLIAVVEAYRPLGNIPIGKDYVARLQKQVSSSFTRSVSSVKNPVLAAKLQVKLGDLCNPLRAILNSTIELNDTLIKHIVLTVLPNLLDRCIDEFNLVGDINDVVIHENCPSWVKAYSPKAKLPIGHTNPFELTDEQAETIKNNEGE